MCDIQFHNSEVFNNHMKHVHLETDDMRIRRLEKTIKSFLEQEATTKKIISENKLKSLDCSECGIIFDTDGQYTLHHEEHHKIKQFKCDECDSMFMTSQGVEYHMKKLHVKGTDDKYKCDKCTEAFSKKYMLVRHRLKDHVEKTVNQISEVVELCDICNRSFTSSKEKINHYNNEHSASDEIEVIETSPVNSNDYTINEFPEKQEKAENVWTVDNDVSYQGMRMKGEGQVYKDACTALKTNLVKDRVFKDSQGRQLTILLVPKGNKPIEVEVTTISKKSKEKRGKAKVHMWEPTKKKPCTIMVSTYSGFDYVFVKTVMEKFIKPFIDALISEPNEDPLGSFSPKMQDKNEVKENISVKVEGDPKLKCVLCGQMCRGKRGLGIHIGRMHASIKCNDSKKRKFGTDNKKVSFCEVEKHICDICGVRCTSKEILNQHSTQCLTQRVAVNNSVEPNIENKHEDIKVPKSVSKLCSECDLKIEALNGKDLVLETIKHNSVCIMKVVVNAARTNIEPIKSPPRKKLKDTESDKIEEELDNIVNKIKAMDVDDLIIEPMKEEEVIPEQLRNMFKIKGVDISEHKIKRVGGGGKCGSKCISVHTTGSEHLADEIAINKNEHIAANWENIYKDSYEFPHTERVGGGTMTFETEDEFLIFLLTQPGVASTMWMTHTDMQAVSTMLNMNMSILTTGIHSPFPQRCPRCKVQELFKTEDELRMHTENVHHRVESEEEREGRLLQARWTHLKPDIRIRECIPNEKAEELILLHEDDIHYNIIVHKDHNAYKTVTVEEKHIENDHGENMSIFGDKIHTVEKKTWAEVTKVHRPGYQSSQDTDRTPEGVFQSMVKEDHVESKVDDNVSDFDHKEANDWKPVGKGGHKNIKYNVPVQNRFTNLPDNEDC